MPERKKKGKMTVREAGSKGGKSTSKKYGHDFYVKIGKKGGGRVRELIEAGKRAAEEEKKKGKSR